MTTPLLFYYSLPVETFFLVVAAYLIGSIPVGVMLARVRGKDPRTMGSGNIGATNVMRTAGKSLGIMTLAGDILKGLFPCLFSMYLEQPAYFVALVGLTAFLGHLFPIYLKFKGGKGVATAVGVYLAISPLAVLGTAVIFILVLVKWRYVSLGSLIGAGLMPLAFFVLHIPGAYIGVSILMGSVIFVKHRANISRLLAGTENRIGH